jgi:hypothetical protein
MAGQALTGFLDDQNIRSTATVSVDGVAGLLGRRRASACAPKVLPL